MSRQIVKVPTRKVNGAVWADLSVFGAAHEICGTTVKDRKDISFIDGHRVRVRRFKKMVHWRLPEGTELDITEVGADRRRVVAS